MTRWEKANNKDTLHAELRVAVMKQDVRLMTKLIIVDGIPIGAFDHLAYTIASYHNKELAMNTIVWLDRIEYLVSIQDGDEYCPGSNKDKI